MFSGIVEEVGAVAELRAPAGGAPARLTIAATTVLEGTHPGDSIAVNGACLTVTGIGKDRFSVDVVPETLRRTALGGLRRSDGVNLERAMAYGARVGGHLVQGHVDGTGRIAAIDPDGEAVLVRYQAGPSILRYVVEKGFIAVDGVSLTVVGCGDDWFTVTLIPVTRSNTILGRQRPGCLVNLEADILAKYVERLLKGVGGA